MIASKVMKVVDLVERREGWGSLLAEATRSCNLELRLGFSRKGAGYPFKETTVR